MYNYDCEIKKTFSDIPVFQNNSHIIYRFKITESGALFNISEERNGINRNHVRFNFINADYASAENLIKFLMENSISVTHVLYILDDFGIPYSI